MPAKRENLRVVSTSGRAATVRERWNWVTFRDVPNHLACYGCHLHGSGSGSVDPARNAPGTPVLATDSARAAFEAQRMDQFPYHLDPIRREAVLEAIQEVCTHRGWRLLAAHVRSNHVHTVVEAEIPPERVMSDFKTYASRRLNRMKLDQPNRKRCACARDRGHAMAARDGCGNRSMSRRPCSTSSPSRVMP